MARPHREPSEFHPDRDLSWSSYPYCHLDRVAACPFKRCEKAAACEVPEQHKANWPGAAQLSGDHEKFPAGISNGSAALPIKAGRRSVQSCRTSNRESHSSGWRLVKLCLCPLDRNTTETASIPTPPSRTLSTQTQSAGFSTNLTRQKKRRRWRTTPRTRWPFRSRARLWRRSPTRHRTRFDRGTLPHLRRSLPMMVGLQLLPYAVEQEVCRPVSARASIRTDRSDDAECAPGTCKRRTSAHAGGPR